MERSVCRLVPVLAALGSVLAASAPSAGDIRPILRPRGGPHGGTLVTVAGVASVELVYDCATGGLTAYVLDAHGDPLPLRQDSLRVRVNYADVDGRPIEGSAARFTLDLEAGPKKAGQRPPREASQFRADSAELRGVCHLVGTIDSLPIGTTLLRDVPFRYPGP